MGEAYGTVAAVMLGVYIMFIAPLYGMFEQNERLEQMYVVNEITYFVESIRNTGCMDEAMYLALEGRIASLSGSCEIKLTHYKNIYNEDESSILYFEQEEYEWYIKEQLEREGVYTFKKNEYIKVTVMRDGKMTACYGGSIKNEGVRF